MPQLEDLPLRYTWSIWEQSLGSEQRLLVLLFCKTRLGRIMQSTEKSSAYSDATHKASRGPNHGWCGCCSHADSHRSPRLEVANFSTVSGLKRFVFLCASSTLCISTSSAAVPPLSQVQTFWKLWNHMQGAEPNYCVRQPSPGFHEKAAAVRAVSAEAHGARTARRVWKLSASWT